jgi:uncharacterized phage protein gp47/JayE
MPWSTPTIADLRQQNADAIAGKLGLAILPNGEVRVLADANAANAGLNLEYLDWLSKQFLPDTAEQGFLDKHANIWLVNADGSRGRKVSTFAIGTATVSGIAGTVFPAGSQLSSSTTLYQTIADVTLSAGATPVAIRALDAGSAGNLAAGSTLTILVGNPSVSGRAGAKVVSLTGGADAESDDELRVRVLLRIRQPPMGGAADDYVQWALQVAGVTRAWSSPNEMGIGTVTVRFMCDDLRATNDPATSGLPNAQDIAAVKAYLDTVRPVAVKDLFVVPPITQKVDFTINNLVGGSLAFNAAIRAAVTAMMKSRAAPAHAINGVRQPAVDIPSAWVAEAIYTATSGASFDLAMADAVMASNGCMAVPGTIKFG